MSVQQLSSFDAITRRAMLVLGLVAFALAVITIVVVHPLVDALPSNGVMPIFLATVLLLLGFWMARARYHGGIDQGDVPNVEVPLSTPAPGHNVDQALYRLTQYRQGTIEYKDQIQERLASIAIAVIVHRDDCSREAAVQKLNEGTWTDNAYAASFFTGGSPPKQSLSTRIRNRLTGEKESAYERWVRITVDTIAERSDLNLGEDSEESREDSGGLLARFGVGDDDENAERNVLTPAAYRSAIEKQDSQRLNDSLVYGDLIRTGHWRGITAFTLVTVGWGTGMYQPQVLLLGVVGVAFAVYARAASEPEITDLEVTRHLDDQTPQPGDTVEVTVRVENTGDAFMPDLRLVDRVPGPMRVVEGSPRMATALGSGATATFSYTAVAERGNHDWPLLVLARDWSGSLEREAAIEVEEGIECAPALKTTSDAPVRSQTSLYTGQVDTSMGGSGLEFFAVREYREGDPMKRIDWKRHARTGELATIDFRQERAAKVVFLFDARESAYVSPGPNQRHAVDRSVDAGMELFAALFDRGDLVGMAAFDTVPCWLGPSAGDDHAERARQMFSGHPAIQSLPPELKDVEGQYVDPMTHIRRQLSPETQIMLFSPLCDDYSAEVARRLDSVGHSVTIICPDPTTDETVGQRLANLERELRITDMRERGIRVVDWGSGETLGLQIERAQKRWVA